MPVRAFKGGVHPPDRKAQTNGCAIERTPVPPRLTVPLSQHMGAACLPLVAEGERVRRGQVIGDTDAMIGAPVHAPVDGVVAGVEPVLLASGARSDAIVIHPDEQQQFDRWEPLAPGDGSIRSAVRSAGIVGLGGAAFPTTVKLVVPHDAHIGTVIVNGCECEPYLTCDHRVMLEEPQRVVRGARLVAEAVGAGRVVIVVEDNKADAAALLAEHAGHSVEVLVVRTRYPQGAERQLIWSVLGVEVPHGKLPSAVGALVNNVATVAAIASAVDDRKPLIERVVTVSGTVRIPGNYLTLLGTPVSALIEAAGGVSGPVRRIVAGGPMTGVALADLAVPVVKGMSAVIALGASDALAAAHEDRPCIRCARCVDACPMMLEPYALGIQANRGNWDHAERLHAFQCIECGCCAFICPTRRPLVQLIREAKRVLMLRGASA